MSQDVQISMHTLHSYAQRAFAGNPLRAEDWLTLLSLQNKLSSRSEPHQTTNILALCRDNTSMSTFRELLLFLTLTQESRANWVAPVENFEKFSSTRVKWAICQNGAQMANLTSTLLLLLYNMSSEQVVRKTLHHKGFLLPLMTIVSAPQCLCFRESINQITDKQPHSLPRRHVRGCFENCGQLAAHIFNRNKIRNLAINIVCNLCHCEPLKEMIGGINGARRLRALVACTEYSFLQKQWSIGASCAASLVNLSTNLCNCRVLASMNLFGRLLVLMQQLHDTFNASQCTNESTPNYVRKEDKDAQKDLLTHLLVLFVNASKSVRTVKLLFDQTTQLYKTLNSVGTTLSLEKAFEAFQLNVDKQTQRFEKAEFDEDDEGTMKNLLQFDNEEIDYNNRTDRSCSGSSYYNYSSPNMNAANNINKRHDKNHSPKAKHKISRKQSMHDAAALESAQVFVQAKWQNDAFGRGSNNNSRRQSVAHDLPLECQVPFIDYQKIQKGNGLGKGAYSHVYRAQYHSSTFAIKIGKYPLSSDKAKFTRDVMEYQFMAMLRHPNIIQLLGVSLTRQKRLVICVELCGRGALKDVLKRCTDPVLRVAFARDIISGLHWMHSRSVLHRDLKPANILVRQNYSVVIADFGMSLYTGSNPNQRPISNHFRGNVKYAAPELLDVHYNMQGNILNGRIVYPYTTKSDIYSFGLILWEILAPKEVLFPKLKGKKQIAQFVTGGGRPHMLAEFTPSTISLLNAVWHNVPAQRPEFAIIMQSFQQVALDHVCPDKALQNVVQNLWGSTGATKQDNANKNAKVSFCEVENWSRKVKFEEFERQLESSVGHRLYDHVTRAEDIRFCLRYMLCDCHESHDWVTLQRLRNFSLYFGSIRDWHRMCTTLVQLFGTGWFFGFLRKKQSQHFLARALQKHRSARGFYLIRFSATDPGCYIIDFIMRDGATFQRRITHSFESPFTLFNNQVSQPMSYYSLFELVRECNQCETCLKGLRGLNCSPLKIFFQSSDDASSGYTVSNNHQVGTSVSNSGSANQFALQQHVVLPNIANKRRKSLPPQMPLHNDALSNNNDDNKQNQAHNFVPKQKTNNGTMLPVWQNQQTFDQHVVQPVQQFPKQSSATRQTNGNPNSTFQTARRAKANSSNNKKTGIQQLASNGTKRIGSNTAATTGKIVSPRLSAKTKQSRPKSNASGHSLRSAIQNIGQRPNENDLLKYI